MIENYCWSKALFIKSHVWIAFALQEIVKKCEQNVSDHERYKESYSDCSAWLRNAKEKSRDCTDLSGSRAELDSKQDQVNVSKMY
jgi:hypothetical protein